MGPTVAEFRTVFFPTGFLGLIGLLTADGLSGSPHLSSAPWFIPLVCISILCMLVGAIAFIAHLRLRALPVLAISLVGLGITLHWSAWYLYASICAAIVVTYVFSHNPLDGDTPASELRLTIAELTRQLEAATLQVDAAQQQRNGAQQQLDGVQQQRDAFASQLKDAQHQRDEALSKLTIFEEQRRLDTTLSLLTEVESWLEISSESKPAAKPDHPIIEMLERGRYEAQLAQEYKETFEDRLKAAFASVSSNNRIRNAEVESFLLQGPRNGDDIRRIVRYIRYLETGNRIG